MTPFQKIKEAEFPEELLKQKEELLETAKKNGVIHIVRLAGWKLPIIRWALQQLKS